MGMYRVLTMQFAPRFPYESIQPWEMVRCVRVKMRHLYLLNHPSESANLISPTRKAYDGHMCVFEHELRTSVIYDLPNR